MQNKNTHTVSEQELDNLLKQAFLNLDTQNPKTLNLMETVANQHLTKPIFFGNLFISRFFSFKYLIILFSLISSCAFIGWLYNDAYSIPVKPPITLLVKEEAAAKILPAARKPEPAQDLVENVHSPFKIIPQKTLISPANYAIIGRQLQDDGIYEMMPPVFKENVKQITEDTAYVFPVLTEQEIKTNHKQKKKMVDALTRFSKDKYGFVPMGSCIYRSDTISCYALYMQTTEVSNLEYRTFLFDLLINGKKQEFLKAKPDQEAWTKKYKWIQLTPMQDLYFSHAAYNDYPVVNISKQGAEMYCNWLTIESNKKLQEAGKTLINDLRIPSDLEWVYVASNKKNKVKYANGFDNLRDKKGSYIQNYSCATLSECEYDAAYDLYLPQRFRLKDSATTRFKDDGGFIMVKGRSYAPNDYNIYCMAGNVSEMVKIYNIKTNTYEGFGSKGGNWYSCDYFLEIDAKQEFKNPEQPSPLIGFRPVITAMIP